MKAILCSALGLLPLATAQAQSDGGHTYTARGTTCEARSTVDAGGIVHFRVYWLTGEVGGARIDLALAKLPVADGATLLSLRRGAGYDRDFEVTYSDGTLHTYSRRYSEPGDTVWTEVAVDATLLHPTSASITTGVAGVPAKTTACAF